MALQVGVNSYISVQDADAYFADRLDADAWENADSETKAKALITATKRIDAQRFQGIPKDPQQALQFPRCYRAMDRQTATIALELRDPLMEHRHLMLGAYLCETDVPQAVKDATCEEALYLLSMTAYQKKREREHELGMVGGGIGDANEYAQQTVIQRKATGGRGLYSPEARQLLAPYLAKSAVVV